MSCVCSGENRVKCWVTFLIVNPFAGFHHRDTRQNTFLSRIQYFNSLSSSSQYIIIINYKNVTWDRGMDNNNIPKVRGTSYRTSHTVSIWFWQVTAFELSISIQRKYSFFCLFFYFYNFFITVSVLRNIHFLYDVYTRFPKFKLVFT